MAKWHMPPPASCLDHSAAVECADWRDPCLPAGVGTGPGLRSWACTLLQRARGHHAGPGSPAIPLLGAWVPECSPACPSCLGLPRRGQVACEAKIPAKSKAWDHLPTLPGGPGVGKEPPSRHSRLGKQVSHGRPQCWEVAELWSLPNPLQGQCTPRPSLWSWSLRS